MVTYETDRLKADSPLVVKRAGRLMQLGPPWSQLRTASRIYASSHLCGAWRLGQLEEARVSYRGASATTPTHDAETSGSQGSPRHA